MKTTLAKIQLERLSGSSVLDNPDLYAQVQAQAQHIYYALSKAEQVCTAMKTLLAGDFTDSNQTTRDVESLRRVLTKLGF